VKNVRWKQKDFHGSLSFFSLVEFISATSFIVVSNIVNRMAVTTTSSSLILEDCLLTDKETNMMKALVTYGALRWVDTALPADFNKKLDEAFTHISIWNNQSSIKCFNQWFPTYLHILIADHIPYTTIKDMVKQWTTFDHLNFHASQRTFEDTLTQWNNCSHTSTCTKPNFCGLECEPCFIEHFKKTFCIVCATTFYDNHKIILSSM